MTKTNIDLSELLAKQDGGDFLRNFAEAVLQLIMKSDVGGRLVPASTSAEMIYATWRNGYQERSLCNISSEQYPRGCTAP